MNPYAEAALRGELERIRRAPVGARNHTLNAAAFSIGTLVGAGLLAGSDVSTSLLRAALAVGLSDSEARRTITSGLEAGIRQPRRTA
jgi:hypothetical protein